MRFYYFSFFSAAAFAIVGLIAFVAFWLYWTKVLKHKPTSKAFWPVFIALQALPWTEELWIAFNFDRYCRMDAGYLIYKTVEVDGFYDETHSWTERRMREEPGYQFVEGRAQIAGKHIYWRHDRVGNEIRTYKIDRPTARYHYTWPHKHTPVAHKVSKIERIVIDSQTDDVLARETKYARDAYLFFIGLNRPVMLCPAPGQDPLERFGSVYRTALKPAGKQ